MAGDLEWKDDLATNPCCNEWKNRLTKLFKRFEKNEKARKALKEAVDLYEQQFALVEATNQKLKNAYEAEKLQTDQERKEKEKESAARASLENEISTLKSEILSLSQKGAEHADKELILLRGRVFDSEKEINYLKEQLQKEKSVAAAYRMKYVEEKKRADEAWQSSMAGKGSTDKELSDLKARLRTMETEKKQLRKDLQKERDRADSEKKRADEALKTAKTDQIGAEENKAEKKSEDLLLQHKGQLVTEMETEISRLKEHLDKERKRADSETKKAEAEKKKANKVREMLKAEQSAADEQRKLVDVERKKTEENAHQLERLKREANEARSKVVIPDSLKFKELNKKLEAERRKSMKEKKKGEQQQKIADLSTKNALEEKQRADRFHQQLEEYQQKYDKLKKEMEETVKRTFTREVNVGNQGEEKITGTNTARTVKNHGQVKQKTSQANLEMEKEAELKKAAEMYKLQATTEKSRADKLAQQLKDITNQRTKNASKDIQDLVSSRNLTDPSFVRIQKDIEDNSAEKKLLKEKLKLEKEKVKHANRVAELEKNCKKAAEEELHRIKMEFARFSNRIGLCSCFPICNVGKACSEKNGNVDSTRKFMQTEACPLHLQSGKELMEMGPTCAVTKSSEYFKQNLDRMAPSLPISGTCNESTSGTASKMEPLLGGSNRKNVGNSALVSSMGSFSDKQLVGSQGNCGFLNNKPADKAKENSNVQLASEANRTSNDAVVADNNVKSPLKVRSKDGNTKKRKRLVNAIESIEHLYAEGKTWHAKMAKNMSELHGILGHMDKPLEEGMHSDSDHHNREIEEVPVRTSCKSIEQKEEPRIKAVGDEDNGVEATHTSNSDLGKLATSCKSVEQKEEPRIKAVGDEDNAVEATHTSNSDLGKLATSCKSVEQMEEPRIKAVGDEDNAVETTHTSNSDLGKLANDVEIFKRMFDGDCMKLLDLDSVVEEERYRAAVECPLSPTLPNIEFDCNQLNELDHSRPSEVNYSSGELQMVGTCMIPCSSSGDRTKEASYNMSTLKAYDDSVEIFRNGDSDAVMGILDSGDKENKSSGGNESGSAYDVEFPQYFVVFPEISQSNSLSKIFHTTRTFTSQCCEISQSDSVVKNVVSALSADKILSSKEKVCVFFSLFLKSFSGVALTNFNHVFDGNFLNNLDIFSGHMRKVISDVETRTFFSEVCNLDELITLIQDFIINQRVLVHNDKSSEILSILENNAHILLKDEGVSLSLNNALLHQLVLGAVLLASVCSAFGRIESICETSYAISRITSSSTMTILHVFAYLCGEKLLCHGDYSLIMTVVNSLVTYCERANLSFGFPSCTKCPFFDGAVSMEELASLLLKRLWSYALCAQCEGCSTAFCMHEIGITTCKSPTKADGTLFKLGDVLSLLELVASNMNWSWVCDNIISQLVQLLDACVKETLLTAIFVLLGQLASIGIDANGFQDVAVENIRVKLSSFIYGDTSSKISLPVQFAAVNALLDTMGVSFQEVCNNSEDLPMLVNPSTPTDYIQKWFSLLSDEQKSLSVEILTVDLS